ncbi:MAG: hypothetical protein ACLSD3_04535 [Acutalibacteraceae bacterium]
MASADYLPLVQAARERVLRISAQQSRDLARIYAEIAADLRWESAKRGVHTLTYRFLMDYAKNLRKESEEIFAGQRDLIAGNLRSAAGTTVEAQRAFFAQAAPQLSGRFSDVFSRASQKAVNELLSGGIYENFAGLSERIWNYRGSFDRDISEIIRRGILAKKPAFNLAKDLELYLDPSAAKPWDWNKVYPGVSRKVDYNAQRLARTSVTHAYQLALERSTRDNPFVTKYQWLAGNSHARICGLCLSRDGKYFDKGSVPLDHPNGMCTIIPVIEKSYEEIAAELADWANGGENPALDNWLLNNSTKDAIIKNEIRRALSLKDSAVLHIPAHLVDIEKLGFDAEHIIGRHDADEMRAKQWIRNSILSVTVWNGRYERYYSQSGIAYVDLNGQFIRTAFSSAEFEDKEKLLLEVLKKYGFL